MPAPAIGSRARTREGLNGERMWDHGVPDRRDWCPHCERYTTTTGTWLGSGDGWQAAWADVVFDCCGRAELEG